MYFIIILYLNKVVRGEMSTRAYLFGISIFNHIYLITKNANKMNSSGSQRATAESSKCSVGRKSKKFYDNVMKKKTSAEQ